MAPIQFGILMIEYQTLDVAGPLDILSSASKALISGYEALGLPEFAGLTEKAIDIEFHHINETMGASSFILLLIEPQYPFLSNVLTSTQTRFN